MSVIENKLVKLVAQRLPILQWAPNYTYHKLVSDSIAGITVALTVMPQALAYATLGGLEPQYGLYSAFMGCFVYIIFGSCKEITLGPTALMALMTYQQIQDRNSDYAILLCFLSGIVQLVMATLNLGILVDFISIPVTVGFTSATSVIIAVSQFKGLLGLNFTSSGFIDTLVKVYQNIDKVRIYDCILSIICIAILIGLRKLKDFKLYGKNDKKPTSTQVFLSRALWLVSTSRNALIVIICSLIAYCYKNAGLESPFLLTGSIKPGLPQVKLPPFSTTINNETVHFGEMISDLGTSVFLVPIIAVLGNVAIAKAFSGGQGVNATQELLTLSLANIFGSFFSSMPITGSFSRSAVNHASGVQTPLGGIFTGTIVLLALGFLTPYFAYIPKSSLAAVIICAVIFMIEYEVVKPMWRSSKKDLIPTFATFSLCLAIGVELGILIGVAINMVFLLYPSARPKIIVEKKTTKHEVEYILITPANSLYFPGIEFIKSSIGKAGLASSHLPLVVDCRYIFGADFTAAKGIAALVNDFISRKQPLYFLTPRDEIITVFKEVIADDFEYFTSDEEMNECLKIYRQRNGLGECNQLLLSCETTDSETCSLNELTEVTCTSNRKEFGSLQLKLNDIS